MGIAEIRALKAAKTGSVMTAKEVQELAKGKKFGANPMEGKFHAGHYETSYGLIYFRSKWEANYALYLDWLIKHGEIKSWKYEPETFFFEGIRMGTNCYKPDYRVVNKDDSIEYHEVKGYFDSKSKTKLKRMKKYHPNVKVILIERKQYDAIIKSNVVKFHK